MESLRSALGLGGSQPPMGVELDAVTMGSLCEGLRVPFAVGALNATVLPFSLGLFWPRLIGRWGSVIGLPVALEEFAFSQDSDVCIEQGGRFFRR